MHTQFMKHLSCPQHAQLPNSRDSDPDDFIQFYSTISHYIALLGRVDGVCCVILSVLPQDHHSQPFCKIIQESAAAPNGRLGAMAAVQGFEHRKQTFLAKCDKSSAGEIDEKAREICAELNARPAFFTTSSCSGRAFIWRGDGVKSTDCFSRWRVSHDLVDAGYFDLKTLDAGSCGNGAGAPVTRWRWLRQLATVSSWCRGGAWQGRKHQRPERAELAEKLLESPLAEATEMGRVSVGISVGIKLGKIIGKITGNICLRLSVGFRWVAEKMWIFRMVLDNN